MCKFLTCALSSSATPWGCSLFPHPHPRSACPVPCWVVATDSSHWNLNFNISKAESLCPDPNWVPCHCSIRRTGESSATPVWLCICQLVGCSCFVSSRLMSLLLFQWTLLLTTLVHIIIIIFHLVTFLLISYWILNLCMFHITQNYLPKIQIRIFLLISACYGSNLPYNWMKFQTLRRHSKLPLMRLPNPPLRTSFPQHLVTKPPSLLCICVFLISSLARPPAHYSWQPCLLPIKILLIHHIYLKYQSLPWYLFFLLSE